jgi:hypothetical protein
MQILQKSDTLCSLSPNGTTLKRKTKRWKSKFHAENGKVVVHTPGFQKKSKKL